MNEDRFMTVFELCQYLRISRSCAYKLCGSRNFPVVRVGRKILIDKHRLESEWLLKKGE